jgi:phospholipid transport system transporter-binding protein
VTSAPLRIERGDAASMRVAGRLGFSEAAAALARSGELLDAGTAGAPGRAIKVDIAGLEGVDSATLAVLLAWAARASARGMSLSFTGVPPGLLALAHLCDAERLLGIA